jgi:hypothetical protein
MVKLKSLRFPSSRYFETLSGQSAFILSIIIRSSKINGALRVLEYAAKIINTIMIKGQICLRKDFFIDGFFKRIIKLISACQLLK